MIRPPGYWARPPDSPGWQARALGPVAALVARIAMWRSGQQGTRPGIPVICVGNLTVGGEGKTPTVIALAQKLSHRGRQVHILSRGYGGAVAAPARVDPRLHTAADVGDEPLLLAAFAPVWVGRDRVETARAAQASGADILLMDDGFQNPSLVKSLSVLVIDAEYGFGNGRVLPAGPLREPIQPGLRRADMVLTLGQPSDQQRFATRYGDMIDRPWLHGQITPLQTGMEWAGLRVLAFAGIARPEKFFDTLTSLGAHLSATHALADHHPLSRALLMRLERQAAALGAQLVTTEKDAVRLPASYRGKVLTLPVRLELADPAPLEAALDRIGVYSETQVT